MKQIDDLEKLLRSYREKFGYLPGGFNMPELTAELLRQAIESGYDVEAQPIPDGANY